MIGRRRRYCCASLLKPGRRTQLKDVHARFAAVTGTSAVRSTAAPVRRRQAEDVPICPSS